MASSDVMGVDPMSAVICSQMAKKKPAKRAKVAKGAKGGKKKR